MSPKNMYQLGKAMIPSIVWLSSILSFDVIFLCVVNPNLYYVNEARLQAVVLVRQDSIYKIRLSIESISFEI